MKTPTLYTATYKGRVVACGNLQQCWLWVFNSFDKHMTVAELVKCGVYISPKTKKEIL